MSLFHRRSNGAAENFIWFSFCSNLLSIFFADLRVQFRFCIKNPPLSLWLDRSMIAFITWNSNLVPLFEGLCSSNPCRFEFSVFGGFAGIELTTLAENHQGDEMSEDVKNQVLLKPYERRYVNRLVVACTKGVKTVCTTLMKAMKTQETTCTFALKCN